jgi:hypothetical protein
MGLLTCSAKIGLIMLAPRNVGDPDNDLPVIALHFILALLISCLLCLAFRRQSGVGYSSKAALRCFFYLSCPVLYA